MPMQTFEVKIDSSKQSVICAMYLISTWLFLLQLHNYESLFCSSSDHIFNSMIDFVSQKILIQNYFYHSKGNDIF